MANPIAAPIAKFASPLAILPPMDFKVEPNLEEALSAD